VGAALTVPGGAAIAWLDAEEKIALMTDTGEIVAVTEIAHVSALSAVSGTSFTL
jgi:hypothetical protein